MKKVVDVFIYLIGGIIGVITVIFLEKIVIWVRSIDWDMVHNLETFWIYIIVYAISGALFVGFKISKEKNKINNVVEKEIQYGRWIWLLVVGITIILLILKSTYKIGVIPEAILIIFFFLLVTIGFAFRTE